MQMIHWHCFVVVVLFANILIIKFLQILPPNGGKHRRKALLLPLVSYSTNACAVSCVGTVTKLTANTGVCTREGPLQVG